MPTSKSQGLTSYGLHYLKVAKGVDTQTPYASAKVLGKTSSSHNRAPQYTLESKKK